jgi:hypothetical protein
MSMKTIIPGFDSPAAVRRALGLPPASTPAAPAAPPPRRGRRSRYTAEQRARVAQLFAQNMKVKDVARQTGIPWGSLAMLR